MACSKCSIKFTITIITYYYYYYYGASVILHLGLKSVFVQMQVKYTFVLFLLCFVVFALGIQGMGWRLGAM